MYIYIYIYIYEAMLRPYPPSPSPFQCWGFQTRDPTPRRGTAAEPGGGAGPNIEMGGKGGGQGLCTICVGGYMWMCMCNFISICILNVSF